MAVKKIALKDSIHKKEHVLSGRMSE